MAGKNIAPQYWINPNFRLNFPLFRVEWHMIDDYVLRQEARIEEPNRYCYTSHNSCMLIMKCDDQSVLYLIYSDKTYFENIRMQSWLRKTIRDLVVARAKEVLPDRLHKLEKTHNLYAKGVVVKKLRKGVLGQCNSYKIISLSPLLVIFPMEFMDMVILHEMAHLKYMHHRSSFWKYLSLLLHDDAKQQNELRNIVLSKYVGFYEFLMK